jgi:hypothetical protein
MQEMCQFCLFLLCNRIFSAGCTNEKQIGYVQGEDRACRSIMANGDTERAPERQDHSAYSPRAWRSCCLAPTLALAAVLLISVTARLWDLGGGAPSAPGARQRSDTGLEKRGVFVEFGREYFAIADRADKISESAFQELNSFVGGNGSVDGVRAAFRKASVANARASWEFKQLAIPSALASRDKLRRSLDLISRSYTARQRACDVIAGWNGDVNDRAASSKYEEYVQEVDMLTSEALSHFKVASQDNGLTEDDYRKFMPGENGRYADERGDMLVRLWSERSVFRR